jgi:hypothetical protein
MAPSKLRSVLALCIAVSGAPVAANAPANISRPVQIFAEPSEADLREIDALADQFFLTLQSDGAVGIIALLPEQVQLLPGIYDLFEKIDETCPAWDRLSAGEQKVFSADVLERAVFTLSDTCMLRWRLTFARRPEGWRLFSVQVDAAPAWR